MKLKKIYLNKNKKIICKWICFRQEIEKMSLGKSILKDMESIKTSLTELDKIALKPRILINEEFFKRIIEYEVSEKNPGYENRLKDLKRYKNIPDK